MHHLLNRAGRRWLKELWQAVQEAARADPSLTPFAAAVQADLAASFPAPEDLAAVVHEAYSQVIRTGYATRMLLVGPTEQPSPDPTWFGLPRVGAEPDPDDSSAIAALSATVRRLASNDFTSAMTLPDEVWRAYVATATRAFQRTGAGAGGSVSWRELAPERVDELLRCGYLLRCIDEARERAPA